MHVEFPRLDGVRRFAKRTFDLLSLVVLILVAQLQATHEGPQLGRVAKGAGAPVECRDEAEASVVIAGGLV